MTGVFIPPYTLSYISRIHTYRHIHTDEYTMPLVPVIEQWRPYWKVAGILRNVPVGF